MALRPILPSRRPRASTVRRHATLSAVIAVSLLLTDGVGVEWPEASAPRGQPVAAGDLQELRRVAESREGAGDMAGAAQAIRDLIDRQRERFGDGRLVFDSLAWLARLEFAMGHRASAESLLQQAVEIPRAALGDDHPEYANGLFLLAAFYVESQDFTRALALLAEALAIQDRALPTDHPDRVGTLMGLGRVHLALGEHAKAESRFREALEARRRALGDGHSDLASSLNGLAAVYLATADHARAEPLLREATAIVRRARGGDHPEYATVVANWAMALEGRGRLDEAADRFREALDLRRRLFGSHHPETVALIDRLALLEERRGRYDVAEALFAEVVQIREATVGSSSAEYATSLNNLAGLYWATGAYAQAEPLLREALEIVGSVSGTASADYALSLFNLSWLYLEMGDSASVEPRLLEAIVIQRKAKGEQDPTYATMLNRLGLYYLTTGQYGRAASALEAAMTIRERLGETHMAYLESLTNLGGLRLYEGDYERARALFEQVRAAYERAVGTTHPSYVTALYNLARTDHFAGEYASALAVYERVLDGRRARLGEAHPAYAGVLADVAEVRALLGDVDRAAEQSRQAVRLVRRHSERTAAALSERQQLAEISGTRRYLDSYLSLAAEAEVPADESYEELLAWKGAFHVRQRQVRALRRLAAEDPSLAATFAALEDATRELGSLTMAGATPVAGEQGARAARIDALIDRVEQLERTLSGHGDRAQRELASTSPEDVRAMLPARTVLIDVIDYRYLRALDDPYSAPSDRELRTAAFVVRPGRPVERVELGPTRTVASFVDAWRSAPGRDPDVSARLRQLVWDPLGVDPDGVDTVLLAPDGALARLPWAALPSAAPGHFLIEDMAFAVVPVPRLLPAMSRDASRLTPSLLTMGNVDYDADPGGARQVGRAPRGGALGGWSPLEQTGLEAERIAARFVTRYPRAPVTSLSGSAAREVAARDALPSHRWAHLATHGFFADEELRSALDLAGQSVEWPLPTMDTAPGPRGVRDRRVTGWRPGLLSGLVLAGANRDGVGTGERDDGILTATEIAALDLSGLELATLSACETGLGRSAGGEGMLGLQRAFQIAGAHTVVAGLWQVDDRATRRLMETMYRALWDDGRPAFEALREAQLSMLRSPDPVDREPYAWAAFVVSGAWR